jgi:hypothetical protein
MSTATPQPRRPLTRRIQARAFRVINVPMRNLLALPFPTPPGRSLMLLYLTGRRTGRHYRQPVSYIPDRDTLLTPGGGRWKLNLSEGERVRIRLRGRDIQAVPEIISDPQHVQRLLGVMTSQSRMVKRFVAIPQSPGGQFDRDGLQVAIDHGFRIIRWHPKQP